MPARIQTEATLAEMGPTALIVQVLTQEFAKEVNGDPWAIDDIWTNAVQFRLDLNTSKIIRSNTITLLYGHIPTDICSGSPRPSDSSLLLRMAMAFFVVISGKSISMYVCKLPDRLPAYSKGEAVGPSMNFDVLATIMELDVPQCARTACRFRCLDL